MSETVLAWIIGIALVLFLGPIGVAIVVIAWLTSKR